MNHFTGLIVGSILVLAACNRQEARATEADDPAPLTDAALDAVDVPVKEDFEEKAYAAINEDNVESQVDALEQEISRDAE